MPKYLSQTNKYDNKYQKYAAQGLARMRIAMREEEEPSTRFFVSTDQYLIFEILNDYNYISKKAKGIRKITTLMRAIREITYYQKCLKTSHHVKKVTLPIMRKAEEIKSCLRERIKEIKKRNIKKEN